MELNDMNRIGCYGNASDKYDIDPCTSDSSIVDTAMSLADSRIASLTAENERLRAALVEIVAINSESQSTFNKRGGTRRGLSIGVASAALVRS